MALHILLLLLFLVISGLSTYTDLKKNIVPNILIIVGLGLTLVLQVIFVAINGISVLSLSYFIQIIFSVITAILFYVFRVWAGGDTKLFILLTLMLPIDFIAKSFWNSVLSIIVMAYAIAFIYIIAESVWLAIKKEPVLISGKKIRWKDFLVNWLFYFSILTIIQRVLHLFLGTYYSDHSVYFLFLNVFIAFILGRINIKILIKFIVGIILAIAVIVWQIVLHESVHVYLSDILIVTVVYLLRFWGNRFNYMEIAVSELKSGMIPAAITVLQFANSRVKGLPQNITEDMSARLTKDEVDSIKRWADTKKGCDSVWIVRKIPFALFICISFAFFWLRGFYGQIF